LRFRNREERERYMDSLERQIEHQREQMQRTLDRIEGSARRRMTLKSKLRSSLAGFPGRARVLGDVEESEGATEKQEDDGEAPRSWWEVWR
jgi:hypothetical protein